MYQSVDIVFSAHKKNFVFPYSVTWGVSGVEIDHPNLYERLRGLIGTSYIQVQHLEFYRS